MKLMRLLLLMLLVLSQRYEVSAQDFSNKGKDFWLCFPSHVPNERFGVFYYAKMSLFITGDKNSSGTVSIPGLFNTNFSIAAGQTIEIDIPYSTAHILATEAGQIIRKGIRVKTDVNKPAVVVYAHIYAGYRSAASLILPATVLGKKYYSMNAPQQGTADSKSQFVVVAVDTNTTVQIIPVREGIKGQRFTINLPLPGDLYELQDEQDLTGSSIESIANGAEGCKKIAVFSGSSAISIEAQTPCEGYPSYDPLYQQLYPVNAWGKTYGFIPFENYTKGNPYRILASENNTSVTVNGAAVALLNEGEYYPDAASFSSTETKAVFISADKPVSVAQYAQRSGCSGAVPPPGSGYGDPDMVLLNAVEQNINKSTVFSSQKENIYSDSKFINILIKDGAVSSFTINGVQPATTWLPMLPAGSGYSYAKIKLAPGQSSFTLKADSGFNAIAYGFGDFESYAYSAGTNVKDLLKTLRIENEFGHAEVPMGCSNTSFKISVTFPYQPSKIKIFFSGLFPDETMDQPVPVETFQVNGRAVYRYRLNNTFKIDSVGTFPIMVIADNAFFNACNNGEDELEFIVQIVERPKAEWTFTHSGCVESEATFTDQSDGKGQTLNKWFWSFDDGTEGVNEIAKHAFTTGKEYNVKHWTATTVGCGSDTVTKLVPVTSIPLAAFDVASGFCAGTAATFTNQSTMTGIGTIVQWNWNFGDTAITALNNNPFTHTYTTTGSKNSSLQVQTSSGCKSSLTEKEITVHAVPVANFKIPTFCLPSASTFTNESTISDGTENDLLYSWDFGDGSNGEVVKDPVHQYTTTGPYSVKLTVTTANGCADDSSMTVHTIYGRDQLVAQVTAENCLGDSTVMSVLTTTAGNSMVSAVYWSENNTAFSNVAITTATEFVRSLYFNTPGSQVLRLVGSIATTGCTTDTLVVHPYINKQPTVGFMVAAPLCAQQTVFFKDTSIANDGVLNKWKWEFSNGIVSEEKDAAQTFTTGNYSVKLTAETNKGCADSVLKQLAINHLPLPDFESPKICALDLQAQFTNKSSIADGTAAQFSYKWNFDDVHSNALNPDSSNDSSPAHRYITAGNYGVRLTVTSQDGCVADTVKTFVVNGTSPVAHFVVDESYTLCSDQNIRITDGSTVDFGTIVKTELYWDYENNPTQKIVDHAPAAGKVYTNKYPESYGRDTIYKIRYVAYSGIGCFNEFTNSITVKPVPKIEFNAMAGVCEEKAPFLITAASGQFGLSGTSSFSGPGVDTNGWFYPRQAKPGIHILNYIVRSSEGCTASKAQTIEVFPTPIARAGNDKSIEKGGIVSLDGSAEGSVIEFLWTPLISIDNNRTTRPKVAPAEDIIYQLKVTSAQGCTGSDEVAVKVFKEIKVPDAFTPNKDGLNDLFRARHGDNVSSYRMEIYNRYGQKVFETTDINTGWNGTLGGHLQPTGVFAWIIRYKSSKGPNEQVLKGTVMLIH